MTERRLNLVDACGMAAEIVLKTDGMEPLYRRAVQCIGEGELRQGVMSRAVDAIQDESLSREVLNSKDSMLSFLCGIWTQYLLVEIAGVKKEKFKSMAQGMFKTTQASRTLH